MIKFANPIIIYIHSYIYVNSEMIQSSDETFFRAMVFAGLVVFGTTITMTSSTIRDWMIRSSIELITQHDMDVICETVVGMNEKEISLQWSRDKNRITFVNMDALYIDEQMQWVIPFVTQTVPNSVWCELNAKNSNNVLFTSPSNGLSVYRISDAHIRCSLNFLVVRLDDNNMVYEGDNVGNAEVYVTYDVVDIRCISDEMGDPHIILVGCEKR